MDIRDAEKLAHDLIEIYCPEWTFRLNKNRQQLGVCKEYKHRIELSRHFVLRNSREAVLDTILHEIAHALVGVKHGHDRVWKEMCVELGCKPSACDREADMPAGEWQAQCPGCTRTFSRHRKPKHINRMYCVKCGPEKGALRFINHRLNYERKVAAETKKESVQLMLKIF